MPSDRNMMARQTRPRPFITLTIRKGSRLIDGRLPLKTREREEGIEVDLDPVSFAALFASVGRQLTVDKVVEEVARLGQCQCPGEGGLGKTSGEGDS